MRRVREVIVVEGRYDKNTVAQAVEATIIETSGFGIFSDKEKLALLRRLAERRGVIVLTDSDSAGFFIRGRLRGMLGGACAPYGAGGGGVKHAYVPDIAGRERRKSAPSKEGKLGVEGMRAEVIVAALERAGATFEDDVPGDPAAKPGDPADANNGPRIDHDNLTHRHGNAAVEHCDPAAKPGDPQRITKTDLYLAGLSGGNESAKKRRELLKYLDLPERLPANGLVDAANALFTREEFLALCGKIEK